MKLKKDRKVVELVHEAQIAVYLRAGFVEVKETARKEAKVPDAADDKK